MDLHEKSTSKSQQRFFGMVHKCQKTGDCVSSKVKKVADKIGYKDAEDFASTKHKGLPDKKEESFKNWFTSQLCLFENQDIKMIAKNANLDISKYDMSQILRGMVVEKEHDGGEGKDIDVAKSKADVLKIVLAHLREDPKYYNKLDKAGL